MLEALGKIDFSRQCIASDEERRIFAFIEKSSFDYPGIAEWYYHKVIPGVRCGTRRLVTLKQGACLVAVGIGKMEDGEKKICTVRVGRSFRNKGLGLRVFDALTSWLGEDRPHATVSEDKFPLFERIFKYYGYEITSVREGYYIQGKREYFLNER